MKIGVIAIARPTFDVAFAADTARMAVENLESEGIIVVGNAELCMDERSVEDALALIDEEAIDALVVLQASFADSSLAVAATRLADAPVVLWAFPEDRTGGRLRLNSFCGINLAGYTLTRLGRGYRWMHLAPDDPDASRVVSQAAVAGPAEFVDADPPSLDDIPEDRVARARTVVERLGGTVVGRVGDTPDGFEPCAYEAVLLREALGVRVEEVSLPELFSRSAAASESDIQDARSRADVFLSGVDDVNQGELEKSLALNVGLASLIEDRRWAGVATRCWPETFTEFGGAACTPMALLAADGTPGSCEADVYGNITGLVLQWLAGSASFVADLVHLDPISNTGVFWHCGLAPFELADADAVPVATIHSNRAMPLLSEFPLKPGRVTLARFSQSRGVHRLVIGTAEMLRAPLAFSGTAGVARFDAPVNDIEDTILGEGLEHHYGLVYGDVSEELRAVAALLALPVVEL
jgi:L-fucose isomerase-like protein